jgi:hypothetical protein
MVLGTQVTTFATAAGPSTIWLMANQVHVPDHHPRHDELTKQLTDHLAQHVEHASTTAAYHGGQRLPGDTGESSQGSFQPGGAAGAEYQTSSADSVGDADSGGPSGL